MTASAFLINLLENEFSLEIFKFLKAAIHFSIFLAYGLLLLFAL